MSDMEGHTEDAPPPYEMVVDMTSFEDIPPPPSYDKPQLQGVEGEELKNSSEFQEIKSLLSNFKIYIIILSSVLGDTTQHADPKFFDFSLGFIDFMPQKLADGTYQDFAWDSLLSTSVSGSD